MRLLETAKDVNKFTKFVIEKYDELRRQMESICTQPSPQPAAAGDTYVTGTQRYSKAVDRLAAISSSSSSPFPNWHST